MEGGSVGNNNLQPSVSDPPETDLEGFDDFTIASSWERFIAGVEQTCREWQATARPPPLVSGAKKVEGFPKLWVLTKEFSFDSKSYQLDFFFQVTGEDGMRGWSDGLHPLQLWFGVIDFLVMSPLSTSGAAVDASEATLLLSTVAVALANCGSSTPAFVPVHDMKCYQGIQGTKTHTIRYETNCISTWVPVRFMHLEGLYDLFFSKLAFKTAGSLIVPSIDVDFTMRLTYRTPMPGSKHYVTDNVSPDTGNVQHGEWDDGCPWADWLSVEDPVKGFELIATFSERTVRSSMEMAEYENISTLEADKWLLSLIKASEQRDEEKEESVGFAGQLPALVLAFHVAGEADFLEDFAAADKPYILHVTQSLDLPSPADVDHILKEIFQEGPWTSGDGVMDQDYAHGVKGAPADSLFAQFCLHSLQLGGCNIRAIAVLWIEFVREVRWYWDEGRTLPRMSPNARPDLSTCLLHQKLQLLALCIEEKARKQGVGGGQMTAPQGEDEQAATETQEEPDVSEVLETARMSSTAIDQIHDDLSTGNDSDEIWEDTMEEQAEMESVFGIGEERQKGLDGDSETKVLDSTHSLHSPVTQKPPVATEDMLEEQEQFLAALYKSPSVSFLSMILEDMAAFKAANPGAVLEDFIRWQSPQEWSENHKSAGSDGDTQSIETGRLSDHVVKPENLWRNIWDNIGTHTPSDQRPLFDYTLEAEKVMHYLDTVQPQELLIQMLATSFLVVANGMKVAFTDSTVPPFLTEEIEELFATMASVLPSLDPLNQPGKNALQHSRDWHTELLRLCAVFERVEANVFMAVSLGQKLKNAPRLLSVFIENNIGFRSNSTSRGGGASEREVVASLFPPLGPTQAWRKSLRMGNFLNGHEPIMREIVFSCHDEPVATSHDGGKQLRQRSHNSYSHRMFIAGTSKDLQVASNIISSD
ncbi:unnamed protein product [Sphagnum troendelagicum]|uniref:Rab3 GTPase-activating protein catalytic subunit n=1 Tax=Sphagnum troendelagicum TaxID=128251 RepID=A0ABP0USP5_9BRYO